MVSFPVFWSETNKNMIFRLFLSSILFFCLSSNLFSFEENHDDLVFESGYVFQSSIPDCEITEQVLKTEKKPVFTGGVVQAPWEEKMHFEIAIISQNFEENREAISNDISSYAKNFFIYLLSDADFHTGNEKRKNTTMIAMKTGFFIYNRHPLKLNPGCHSNTEKLNDKPGGINFHSDLFEERYYDSYTILFYIKEKIFEAALSKLHPPLFISLSLSLSKQYKTSFYPRNKRGAGSRDKRGAGSRDKRGAGSATSAATGAATGVEQAHATSAGQAHATSAGTSAGQAHATSAGQAHATSAGQAHATSAGQAHATIAGQAHATSAGQVHATSMGQAHATSMGQAHTTSTRQAHATSMGQAHATSMGQAFLTMRPGAGYNKNNKHSEVYNV